MRTYLVIPGNPVSQKNTGRRRVYAGGRARSLPRNHSAVKAYRDAALVELKIQWRQEAPIDEPVVVWFEIWRSDNRSQDQGNAMEAVWDAMQAAGVVTDDKWIIPRAIGPIHHEDAHPKVALYLRTWKDELGAEQIIGRIADALATQEEFNHLRQYRPGERIKE